MKIKIAVVDDEKESADTLVGFLGKYFSAIGEKYETVVYTDGMDLVSAYKPYDLIFMDIRMKGLNGMDAAHTVRGMDKEVAIVFVTNMKQLAIKGYDVGALDFIVKPIDYANFEMKMRRVMNELRRRKDVRIMVSQYNMGAVLSSSEIYYIEVLGHTVIYHSSRGEYKTRGSLSELEEKLRPVHFRSCHRCYLVNLAFVEEINENGVVVAGQSLPMSRLKKKEFYEDLANYLGRSR